MTNRLRTEGTDHLLAAARAAGVERVVAQSYAGWPYARAGGPVKTEDDPLDPDAAQGDARDASRRSEHLERDVHEAGGIVLRYGGFYGPGTGITPGGEQWEMVRARKFPLVGDGGGVWSFIHTDDAASATLAALERGRRARSTTSSTTSPRRCASGCPALAQAVGAKPPRHVPRWVGRLLGRHLVLDDVRRPRRVEREGEGSCSTGRPACRPGARASLSSAACRRAAGPRRSCAWGRSAVRRPRRPRRRGARGRRRRSPPPAPLDRRGGTSSPVSPSRRISGRPPCALATTQQPAAAASSAALGSGSGCLLGTAITSAAP